MLDFEMKGGVALSKLGKTKYVVLEGVCLSMSNKTEKEEVLSSIHRLVDSDYVSPYKLGKIESVVRGRFIPPQKIYGYVRQGMIKSSLNNLGKMQIEKKEAIRHLVKTMTKLGQL